MINLPPALIFMAAALIIPFTRGIVRSAFMLTVPLLGIWNLLTLSVGNHWVFNFLNFQLVLGRVDKLTIVFGLIFHIVTFLVLIYILNFKDNLEYCSGFFYAGAALGAVFSGDLISFFIFWEMLTLGSMFLILAGRTEESTKAAFRYTLMHVVGGLILMAGIIIYVFETGSIAFTAMTLGSLGSLLIFIGFGVNCGWPLLHTWITDSYPKSSIGGIIFLSAITTKTAVYALARGFPGADPLIWIGGLMTFLPIFYAVIENDLRKVLAFSMMNQIGYMVVGIGLGTELSINGAAAHAFCHILYKSLLFMSVGAVIYRTGKSKATELGGLYKSMPWTTGFCIVGAASISAFPLFSGFISKSMIQTAAADMHMTFLWFVLLFAGAGVLEHAGIKIPFFTFFGHDGGHRVKEAPINMLIAMGLTAFLCIFLGCFPNVLYNLLPFPVDYVPYTLAHVVTQAQLLFFAALAVFILFLSGVYPAEIKAINLDFDWFYRKGCRLAYYTFDKCLNALNTTVNALIAVGLTNKVIHFFKNAPAYILTALMSPAWALAGKTGEEIKEENKSVVSRFNNSRIPVGFGALLALIFLGVLLLFR